MMRELILAAVLSLVGTVLFNVTNGYSQVTCIQTYVASSDPRGLGFAPSDVEKLVSDIAGAIGLSPQGVKIIPCEGGAKKAEAIYLDRKDIPKGDYILYDPIWIREVIGIDLNDPARQKARYEAIFLFGHELGHLVGRHWTANEGLSPLEKEAAADRFAGCAAGALGADWQAIADFITRIRGDLDTTYPSREHSTALAQEAFNRCRRSGPAPVPPRYQILELGPEFSPPKMNGRTLDGCMISPEHPNGDDCSVQASQTIAARFCKEAGYLSSTTFETLFTSEFKASYKLTKIMTSDGVIEFIWNEDDAGGFVVNRVMCRRE